MIDIAAKLKELYSRYNQSHIKMDYCKYHSVILFQAIHMIHTTYIHTCTHLYICTYTNQTTHTHTQMHTHTNMLLAVHIQDLQLFLAGRQGL